MQAPGPGDALLVVDVQNDFLPGGALGITGGDMIGLVDEAVAGTPLLQTVMRAGRRLPQPSLEQSREFARRQLASLPERCRRLQDPEPLVANVSPALRNAAERVDREFP